MAKPAEAQKAAEQTNNSDSIEGWVLLAAVLLALGYRQVRRRKRS
jgi:MYXO-CTERM domain-containing protein